MRKFPIVGFTTTENGFCFAFVKGDGRRKGGIKLSVLVTSCLQRGQIRGIWDKQRILVFLSQCRKHRIASLSSPDSESRNVSLGRCEYENLLMSTTQQLAVAINAIKVISL